MSVCVWRPALLNRLAAMAILVIFFGTPALAEKIENPVAVFAGLDKVTATIISFDVPVNGTKQFGTLQVTPRVCYTRPITEAPKTTSFVEVNEVQLSGKLQRIFTGWMFAASPGLNAVEHPVYDVWLTNCKTPSASASDGKSSKSPSIPNASSNN